MRIGTWNLAGAWSTQHADAMSAIECDVWLLNGVRPRVSLVGYEQHLGAETSGDGVYWAGILSRRPLTPVADPDHGSAAVRIDDQLFCASQLPWPLMPATAHWPGKDLLDQVDGVLSVLTASFADEPVVWGGAWHQPLAGNIVGFSPRVQEAIVRSLDGMALVAPTADLPGPGGVQRSVDHIAVPATWEVLDRGSAPSPDPGAESGIVWIDALRPRS